MSCCGRSEHIGIIINMAKNLIEFAKYGEKSTCNRAVKIRFRVQVSNNRAE